MRYRRLGFRYHMVVPSGPTWPVLELWPGDRLRLLVQSRWAPDADVCESASAIEVVVDLAGVEDDDVEVQLFDDVLVVDGHRAIPGCHEEAVYLAAGIRRGPFRLELPLPASVDSDRVDARYDRGLIRITLAKREEGA